MDMDLKVTFTRTQPVYVLSEYVCQCVCVWVRGCIQNRSYVLAVDEIHQLGYGPVNEGHVINLIVKPAAEGAHHFLLTPKVGG